MRPFFFLIFFFIFALVAAPALALPTTGASSLVGSNNATVTMTGAATACWFEWGILEGDNMSWRTANKTPAAGVCTDTIRGSPLIGAQKFYYRACDATGCGADSSFTTLPVTPLPTFTYGQIFNNLTSNGFDITLIGLFTIQPYVWIVPTFPGLIWGLLLTGLLIGWWLRGRDLGYVSIVGFIISIAFFGGAWGLGIDLDPTFISFGQGIFYATVSGTILSIVKK